MKPLYRLYKLCLFLYLISGGGALFCQRPEKPELIRVTVDPETGYDLIYWQPSPSPGIDYYVIGKEVILNPFEPSSRTEVGRVDYTATSFESRFTTSGVESVGYSVWAEDHLSADSINYSYYDGPDSTIFARAVFDSCKATITLAWNDYNTWRGNIQKYTVYQRLGSGLYVVIASIPEGTSTYTLTHVQENTTYSLFIEATHLDNIRSSTSNRIDLFTDMSQVPDEINADFATLGANNSIDLSFTVDPNSELQTYTLLRSTNQVGPFDTIATLNTPEKVIHYNDDIGFTSGVYYYKLVAFNNCGDEVVSSNLASNVLLRGNQDNLLISLNWNDYLDWTGGVDHYQVSIETGFQGIYSDSINVGDDSFFSDDFSSRVNYEDSQSTRTCYSITAYEDAEPGRSQHTSRSNRICFNLNPDVRMPNAFIPNSNDGINNTFRPIFSFAPERYELTIFNRSGLKIWEGSEPWDGKVNGDQVTEGVYLYHIKIFNFTNTGRELSGQVAVVYQ
ncbi:MAG: gliding motility-associated C-terminal domain-containing protein [Bacteroidales bacterium]|nr:gliding motility-associated C-terminal domain-containing protein [Bacteroidales bacterium]